MKKQNLFLPLMAATAMLFASCNNNENVPDTTKGEAAKMKITIVSSTTRGISDTSEGVGRENEINKLEAYTFSPAGVLIGYNDAVFTDAPYTLEVAAETGDVTLAVVANSNIGSVATLEALKAKLSTHEFGYGDCLNVPADGFVMSKMQEETVTNLEHPATVSLKRTVSKFNVPTFTSDVLDVSGIPEEMIEQELFTGYNATGTISFEFTSYALANGLDKSLLFNDADYDHTAWPGLRSGWVAPLPSPFPFTYRNSTFDGDGFYTANGVYSGDFVNVPVYTHENFPYPDFQPADYMGYNPKEVYCFIVEGTLTWDGAPNDPVTRYWRVNLVKNTDVDPTNDFYRIFRNGLYKVTVNKIKSIGYGNPKDAEEENDVLPAEAVINIIVDVADWDVYISTTQM